MDSEIAFLKTCFLYSPDTGLLLWKQRPLSHFKSELAWRSWNNKHAGKEAGSKKRYRHVAITIAGKRRHFTAHRLIWAIQTGVWPAHEIDHEDRDTTNHEWTNLREATHVQNMRNKKARCANKTGFRGVYKIRSGRFIAKLQLPDKRLYLGVFETAEAASEAYRIAAKEHYGEFAYLT